MPRETDNPSPIPDKPPLRAGDPVWVLASRGIPIPARCVRIEENVVWVEYHPGEPARSVNIRGVYPRDGGSTDDT
jgi:hypothetical protein